MIFIFFLIILLIKVILCIDKFFVLDVICNVINFILFLGKCIFNVVFNWLIICLVIWYVLLYNCIVFIINGLLIIWFCFKCLYVNIIWFVNEIISCFELIFIVVLEIKFNELIIICNILLLVILIKFL